jgi:hypothetical protein
VLAEAAALLGSHALSVEWSVECLTDSTAPRAIAHSSLVVAGHQAGGGVVGVNGSLELAAPRLWWPNGYGAQHRYRLTVRRWSGAGGAGGSADPGGTPPPPLLDSTTALFGVRHLENLRNPGPSSWQYDK